jgi:hypothetical protein
MLGKNPDLENSKSGNSTLIGISAKAVNPSEREALLHQKPQ